MPKGKTAELELGFFVLRCQHGLLGQLLVLIFGLDVHQWEQWFPRHSTENLLIHSASSLKQFIQDNLLNY